MAYLEFTYEKEVRHIGFLDSPDDRTASLDGPGISVTTHPESWRALKGLNGPEIVLSFTAAQWVDAMTFSDEDMVSIRDWAIQQRYLKMGLRWHALVDAGDGDMLPRAYASREEASKAVGRELSIEIKAFEKGEGACWEEEACHITNRGMKGLERWPGKFENWEQAMILLYVREVVIPKRPYVVGVWWSEPNRPDMGCAPSGVLFPERLHHFEVEDEDGDVLPFAEKYPDFVIPFDPISDFD